MMYAHSDLEKRGYSGRTDHVHPVVRVIANRTNARDVTCTSWERGQHYVYYDPEDDVSAYAWDREGVTLHSVSYDESRGQLVACVFVKEVQTANVFIRDRIDEDGELVPTGHLTCLWDGERRRKQTAT